MSKRRVIEILSDIKEAISRIKKYVTNLNFEKNCGIVWRIMKKY